MLITDIIARAGFQGDEFNTAAAIRRKIAADQPLSGDEIAEWQQLSGKWSTYAQLLDQRDQAQQTQPQAQHDNGVGAALHELQAGRARNVVRRTRRVTNAQAGATEFVYEDDGQPVKEHYRSSGDRAGRGLDRIAAAFERDTHTLPSGARR
ncbi:hypothetical protein [Azospirillum canadense]|uniref:hypothetical protein n=1 Tax=Azospirillum canadense TaxID=403962 RepID=UPI0022276B1B|nr:hypothetical protein [Azospirillum canadense]MCW2237472.1 hypothetical protein [Azospirillum canadense]